MTVFRNTKFGKRFDSLPGDSFTKISVSAILIILAGSIFYHYVEGLAWIDALYFSVVTISTVGYGDFSPQTVTGKLFTIFYIITGIGILFSFINALYDRRMNRRHMNNEKKLENDRNQ